MVFIAFDLKAWVAGRGAPAPGPPIVALRSRGEAPRVPGAAADVGGGEDVRMAWPSAAACEGLRAFARERGCDDPLGHEPHHAAQARRRGPMKCLKKV